MGETRKLAAILVADVVGYSRLAAADEDRTLARLRGLRSDLDRSDHRCASWAHRQANRRRNPHRVSQRGRRRALRGRSPERHDRTQCRPAAGATHRIPHRRPSRRRGRGGDGDLMGDGVNIAARLEGIARARRDLSLRGRLPSGQGAARSRGQRSRPDPTQEHRRADPGLFARGRPACAEAKPAPPQRTKNRPRRASPSSSCRSPISAATRSRSISSTRSQRASPPTSLDTWRRRDRAQSAFASARAPEG